MTSRNIEKPILQSTKPTRTKLILQKTEYTLTAKQTKAFDLLTNDEKVAVLFGGAKGGGKSFLLCLWVMEWVKWLCDYFELKPQHDPIALGFIGRKRSVDFSKTTFETFKKVIPLGIYHINDQKKEIVMYDRAKVHYGGLDDQLTINKFNSAEYAFEAIDQAEETERNDVSVLQASLRLTHNGKVPPYKELYTANPSECWLRNDFVRGKRKDGHYVPALYSENPYLPDNYLDTLETAFSYDPVLLTAYRDGDWDLIQEERIMITPSMLDALIDKYLMFSDVKKIIACDPSRGGDECVIMVLENTKIVKQKIMHERDTRIIEDELINIGSDFGIKDFVIDTIGNDIADGLARKKQNVIRLCSSEKSLRPEKYYNRRSEVWAYSAQVIHSKECYPIEDEETRRQLETVKYRLVNGKVQIEPKETIKKRLGRSPDRGDCFVYGLWGLQFVNSNNAKEERRDYAPQILKYQPSIYKRRLAHVV